MKKLLAICIPTYKRPVSLRRCIDSVVDQVEAFALAGQVRLYIANDASPDDTLDVLRSYASLDYITVANRENNLGMNVNIKTMLQEVSETSEFQLIITDDDYLQPEVLVSIVEFLQARSGTAAGSSAIWTPRYSYKEDGEVRRIACSPFEQSRSIKPSAINAGRYMRNGFILSGLIIKAKDIDFEFWDQYSENGYFPVICFGDLILRNGAYYWHKNLVHHTVLNECHWERWGKNDVVIRMRLFTDFVNAYGILVKRINSPGGKISFYAVSLQGIWGAIKSLLVSNTWQGNQALLLDAIGEFKTHDVPQFEIKIRLLLVIALMLFLMTAAIKFVAHLVLGILAPDKRKRRRHRNTIGKFFNWLRSTPAILKLILT